MDSENKREYSGSSGSTKIPENGAETGKTRNKKRRWRDVIFGGDKVLWIIVSTLLIISVFVTFSSSVYKVSNPTSDVLLRQLIFIGFGILCLLLVHIIKYQVYGRIAYGIFIAGFALTLMMLIIGTETDDARRSLTIMGFNFQPFEILKIGLIMVLAKQLASRQKNIERTPILPSFWPPDWKKNAQKQVDIITSQSVPVLLPVVATCILTFFVVGNSTTLIIALSCLVVLFIGRVRTADLLKIIGVGALFALVLLAAGAGRAGTAKSRISSFGDSMLVKHSTTNANGIEIYDNPGELDQAVNAKMSIASGEFFGRGPGMSTHRTILSSSDKDFAYAFLIEEYGAIGGLVVLLLFIWMFFRSIVIFRKCGTAFPSLLTLGLALMIVLQAVIHMAVSVGLFPVTGQQLPMISRGGSSLVFTLIALGMILGVSRQTAEKTLDNPKGESLFEKA